MAKSILQDWVMSMGLRQQGTLLSGMRGCDTVPKHHPTKLVTRAMRADALHSFDPKPSSYIAHMSHEQLVDLLKPTLDSMDELPSHYVSHFIHAIQILAFYHPLVERRSIWNSYYNRICVRWHVTAETFEQLETRLNAPEERFAVQEDAP